MSGPDGLALLALVLNLCDDLATDFPLLSRSLSRDKIYIKSRFSSEGLSFLTTVLPKLGKAFDQWLSDEDLDSDFSVEYLSPKFLSGVKGFIKDASLATSDRAAIYRWMRQICYLCYKLEIPYTERQLNEAFSAFKQRDKELEDTDNQFTPFDTGEAARILADALKDFNPVIERPKHGPGAVATGEIGDDKWHFKRIYASCHRRFPWYDYFVPTPDVWRADPTFAIRWWAGLERLDYPTARVVAVPKDSRGPRLISAEPLELQYLQQGYSSLLVSHIERHSLASGYINFTRQDINQKLALRGSITGEWATIDLSDASDRVSDFLVYLLFPKRVYQDLRALRSYSTVLPSGETVRLNKFAPMGSAICFPIEALVFWALSKASIRDATKGDGPVYVYGDDIIVRREHYQFVCEGLEHFGLKVNRSKSYHTGFFRESCGVDAWRGYNVTPSRLKHLPPSRASMLESISNWIAVANALQERGYTITADALRKRVSSVVPIPWNVYGTALSFIDKDATHSELERLNKPFKTRWNSSLCRQEVYCLTLKQKSKTSKLAGWQRYHRNLLMMPRDPNSWTPRNEVGTKKRWTSVHPFIRLLKNNAEP